MHLKCSISNHDWISFMNYLLQQFYEPDHVDDFFLSSIQSFYNSASTKPWLECMETIKNCTAKNFIVKSLQNIFGFFHYLQMSLEQIKIDIPKTFSADLVIHSSVIEECYVVPNLALERINEIGLLLICQNPRGDCKRLYFDQLNTQM